MYIDLCSNDLLAIQTVFLNLRPYIDHRGSYISGMDYVIGLYKALDNELSTRSSEMSACCCATQHLFALMIFMLTRLKQDPDDEFI